MKKRILLLSSAKLTAISIGLLLAVFCTIGMSFRPVYDEQEAAEIVMSGPRRSHWKTDKTDSCTGTTTTTYYNRDDYGRVNSVSLGGGSTSVEGNHAKSSSTNSAASTNGSISYVTWNTNVGSNNGQIDDLDGKHTNKVTFTASPADGYRFIGWYAEETCITRKSDQLSYSEEFTIPGANYNAASQNSQYESASTPWTQSRYAKFEKIPTIDVTFLAPSAVESKGYYTISINGTNTDVQESNEEKSVYSEVTLTAHALDNYEFIDWYSQDGSGNITILSTSPTFSTFFTSPVSVGAHINIRPTHLNMTFKAVEKDNNDNLVGLYTVNGVSVSSSDYIHNIGDNYEYSYTLEATPATDYIFYGWYTKQGKTKTYLSRNANYTVTFNKETTVYADFIFNNYPNSELATFLVGSTTYMDLNEANTAASGGSNKTIICNKDGILPPGDYTISSGVTLYIPYSTSNTAQTTPENVHETKTLSAYRTLTLVKGANINCNGIISIGGQIRAGDGGNPSGYVTGACGMINMATGGHIELNSGAVLYCWGFIKGQDMDQGNNTLDVGTVSANSGSTVWEEIAFGDFRGGSACAAITGNKGYRYFPFQSYSIQNIEVPLTLEYGAQEDVYTAVYANSEFINTQTTLIGSSKSLFRLKDAQSVVRKWYNPTTDLACYELNGTAQLDHIELNIAGILDVNSADYDLPITSNMHVIMRNCNMTLANSILVQPGAVMEIMNDATVNIGANLYMFDKNEWDKFVLDKYFYPIANLTTHKNRGDGTSKELLDDAKLIVDGTLNINGNAYTTNSGANIMGNGGGKIVYPSALPANKTIYQVYGSAAGSTSDTKITYEAAFGLVTREAYLRNINYAISANLCNEDGSYTKSTASTTFYNVHGRWFAAADKDEQADHTYNFTYIASGNSGVDANTPAVYSWDKKAALDLTQKWHNVTADACPNWWVGTDTYFYNWTESSDWHQFIPTATEGMYSGSNNKIYTKTDCVWEELGETDVNCLYTISGVKKALVEGQFFELEPNAKDPAYHLASDENRYFICFEGCNWHEATKYANAEKAYVIGEDIFIWYDGAWMNAEWKNPFFYTLDETEVPIYYEYLNGEWVLSDPYIRVIDGLENRTYWFLQDAFTFASSALRQSPTIKILRDLPNVTTSVTYTGTNKTCTLDLNGHTLTGTANKLININATGATFKITSTEPGGVLRMTGKPNNACYYNVYVTKGTLILEGNATIEVDNAATYSGENYALCAIGVASGTTFTMKGGVINARVDRRAYGIESNGTTTLEAGTITCQTLNYAYPYGVQVKAGTTTIKSGVTISCTSGTTYAHPVIQTGGTLTVTGGTFQSYAPTNSSASYQNSAIRVDAGTANISNATLTAEVTGTGTNSKNAYGVYSKGTTTLTNCVASGTTKSSAAYGVYVAGGATTIVSGQYKGTASTAVAGVYKTGDGTTLTIQGGYYSHDTYLAANLAANRGVFATTDVEKAAYGSDMNYKVVEAYAITFMNGDESLQSTVQEKGTIPSYIGTEPIKEPTETETFAFDGWSLTNEGDLLTSLPAVASTATYYAHYTTVGSKYKVTFDVETNGGTSDVKNIYIEQGAAVGTLPVATKTGYTFAGWFTESTGGIKITAATVPASHVIYYAQFTKNSYTLTWNLAGGKVSTAGTAAVKDATGTCSDNIPYGTAIVVPMVSRTGYTFMGWGSTPATAMPAANTSYTATWKANTNTPYKVRHYQQNVDGTYPETPTVIESLLGTTDVSVTPAVKSYEGFISPATQTKTIAADGTMVVEYQYRRIPYTIEWNAHTNGGACTTSSSTILYGATLNSMPTATKTGFRLDGWFTQAIGGVQITGTTPIMQNYGTLYAQFTEVPTYRVTFDANGHGTAPDAQDIVSGEKATEPTVPSETGYTFGGWYKESTCTNAWNFLTDVVTGSTTLFAKWTENKYTVAVEAGANGLVSPASVSDIGCETASGDITATPNAGYLFNGWTLPEGVTAASGYTVASNPIRIHAVAADKTITANFVARTDINYTVKHYQQNVADDNYTEVTADRQNLTGTTAAEVTPAVKEYTGFTAPSTQTKAIAADGSMVIEYRYTRNSYTLSWVTDGDALTGSYTNGSTKYEAPITVPTTPTKTGYTFNGWNPAVPSVMPANNVECVAQWTANTNTPYIVKHYKQQLDGTYSATPDETDNLTGTTATEVTPSVKSYTGFTAPATQTKTIAADGSMEIAYYYTRNTYTITWVDGNGTTIETDENVRYGATPAYDGSTPTKDATAQYTYTFDAWTPAIADVTGDATYTATFSSTVNKYTVTFKNGDVVLQSGEVEYGIIPSYTGATPTKDGDAMYSYTFNGWDNAIVAVTGDATYTATYTTTALLADLTVDNKQTLDVSTTVGTTTITTNGALTIPNGLTLTTGDLILEATTSTSGQVFTEDNNITVTGNAYFDLTLNAQTRTWYGVGVPWRVDPWTGIYGGADSGHLTKLRLGKDFDIIWYNGRVRAASGPVSLCYEYLEKYGDNPELRDVVPGRMYFMFFARPYNVIRFEKKARAELVNEGSVTTERYTGAADQSNHGWNGIANPGLTHVTIPYATPDMGYRYKRVSIDNKGVSQWEKVFNLHTETFVVGQPIMVQLPQDGPIDLGMVRRTTASSAPLRKMTVNGDIDRAEVVMTSSTGLTDRILCVVDDEARDEYTIGADLVMFPNSDELPQLWINNYKHALAVNTIRLENSVATYPLTIVSPKVGDYTLSLANKMADGIHVYLTLNGEAIADLTEGEYVLTMGKETSKAYGIRLVRGPRGTVTAIDEALEGKENVEKVVKDGVLYIIRQGNVYDVSGRKVE